jgi:uncharacterized ferritin-like protein (DUF455 family)
MTNDARRAAQRALACADPAEKVALVRDLSASSLPLDAACELAAPIIPGRPERPALIPPQRVPRRRPASLPGRAALIHAIAHIEFNAINLALDAVVRFHAMPVDYYQDWIGVAAEEAHHFSLLRAHLRGLGYDYGDFPAHDGLWEAARKTADDVLARMALVPRVLEARGLDVTPAMQAKLRAAGDHEAAAILEIILRDEIGHVAVGNRWYQWLCEQRDLPPAATFKALSERYGQSLPRAPFNLEARLAAGFSSEELAAWAEPRPDSRVV